jgi:Tfp pilus assembly protein PilX
MAARNTNRTRRRETGIALLISIFVLLLISVVAIALIVSSGTESALAGNYRSSTGVYYAALSGLEEARGRLLPKNPSSFKNTAGGFLPASGATLPIGSVAYVLNPGPTDAFGTQLTAYPDTQYDTEFGSGALASATVTTTNSVWNISPLNSLNLPGPLYNWVLINAV